MKTFNDFQKLNEELSDAWKSALEKYLGVILQSYEDFNSEKNEYQQKAIAKFKDSLKYTEGKSYIKVVKDGSVHSFIVKAGDKKFQEGDILMPASFNAPAKNKARGNIFGQYSVQWTGPNYLK